MVLRNLSKQRGKFPVMPLWIKQASHKTCCEVCGRRYGWLHMTPEESKLCFLATEAIHHIFPRRYLKRFRRDPNVLQNTISVCSSCHGNGVSAERALRCGDIVTFLMAYQRCGWPMDRINRAAKYYGLHEVVKVLERPIFGI